MAIIGAEIVKSPKSCGACATAFWALLCLPVKGCGAKRRFLLRNLFENMLFWASGNK